MQLQGAMEEKTFSQVFANATEKPPNFNFKIATFLLFGGNRKKLQRVKFHNYRATVWMESKLWKVGL